VPYRLFERVESLSDPVAATLFIQGDNQEASVRRGKLALVMKPAL